MCSRGSNKQNKQVKKLSCTCELCEFSKKCEGNNNKCEITNSTPDIFVCQMPDCQQMFLTTSSFLKHLRTHTDKAPFSCTWDSCNKKFTRNYDLNRHLALHTGEKAFKCSQCPEVFVRADYMRKHVRLFHNPDNPRRTEAEIEEENQDKSRFICEEPGCNKSFKSQSSLQVHRRLHTGARPFACSWQFCDRTFVRLEFLKRHQLQHTGEKKYKCTECKRRFARKDYLAGHMRSHAYRAELQRLKAIKMAEQSASKVPKEKKTKQKSISISNNLKKFLKLPKVDRKGPFCCTWEDCTRSYSRRENLEDHIKRVHAKLNKDEKALNSSSDDDYQDTPPIIEAKPVTPKLGTTIWIPNSVLRQELDFEEEDPLAL